MQNGNLKRSVAMVKTATVRNNQYPTTFLKYKPSGKPKASYMRKNLEFKNELLHDISVFSHIFKC